MHFVYVLSFLAMVVEIAWCRPQPESYGQIPGTSRTCINGICEEQSKRTIRELSRDSLIWSTSRCVDGACNEQKDYSGIGHTLFPKSPVNWSNNNDRIFDTWPVYKN